MANKKCAIKKDLKNIVLNKNYDLIIYRLIGNNYLDFLFSKSDNKWLIDNLTKKDIISEEQIVKLLDRLIFLLKSDFISTLAHQEFIIEKIIISNKELIGDYLKIKNNLNNSEFNDFINQKIYNIIVSNFCKNIKYIPELKELVTKTGISLNKKDHNNLLKIKKLLMDIINCNQKEYHAIYLFSDIDYDIKYEIKRNKIDSKNIINQIISNYIYRYSILLNNYYNKKQYLEIFE